MNLNQISFLQYFAASLAIAAYSAGLMNGDGYQRFQENLQELLYTTPDLKGRLLDWTVEASQASRLSFLANVNLIFAVVLLTFNMMCSLFLGELRLIEEHNLRERTINFLLFKIIFIGAIVEPELLELITWASCFVVLGMIKMLANLGRDRFEHVAVAPNVTTFDHVRLIALLSLVLISCGAWARACINTFWIGGGPNVVLLLLFECITCVIIMMQTLAKYAVHGIDCQFHNGEWDWRGPLWYFIGFFGDVGSLCIAAGHYIHVWTLNGISVNLIDAILFLNIRVTISNIMKQLAGWQNYRRMMHQLNVTYPDATTEELERMDENCAICLRHLDEAKRLPCNHYFHRGCLQRLMENGGTPLCPVCRTPLFAAEAGNGHGGLGGEQGSTNGGPTYGLHIGEHRRRRRRARAARDPEAHRRVVQELFADCPELLQNDQSTPNLRQGQRMISRRIRKRFGSRYYGGTVVRVWQAEPGSHGRVGVNSPIVMYRINYDDGDREDMEWNEISRLLDGITAVGTVGTVEVGGLNGAAALTSASTGAGGSEGVSGGVGSGGRRRSRRSRREGNRGASSPLSKLIMASNVVPVRLHDWTGRSWLYLFATSTSMETVRSTYAKERQIPEDQVELRLFDASNRTIRTVLLDEAVKRPLAAAPEMDCVRGDGGDSGVREEVEEEECQVFAFIHFAGVKEEGEQGEKNKLLRYATDVDRTKMMQQNERVEETQQGERVPGM